MRVLMTGNHTYPLPRTGSGFAPKAMPSAGAQRVHDAVAKGLAELGHEVLYFLTGPVEGPPPPGITIVRELVEDADVLHTYALRDPSYGARWSALGKPWVATCHIDLRSRDRAPAAADDNWVFVSRTLAAAYGRTRHVLNGLDPADYEYSAAKDDYVLFLSSMEWAGKKGLDIALRAASRAGIRIVVAGTARAAADVEAAARLCDAHGAEYVGDVQGEEKARLLARARALLLPTRVNDACPLVIAEALMSGTPVICSANGACPELVDAEVGFICYEDDEYAAAIRDAGAIAPEACRAKAMRDHHYLRMAGDYAREYEREIVHSAARGTVF